MFKSRDQKGGILSKVFIIPAGVVVIISVFLLGYYMGRGQGGRTAGAEKPPALPDVVSQYLPKDKDFTFYKTLTEQGEKNVSVELKPKAGADEPALPKKNDQPPLTEERTVKKPGPEKAQTGGAAPKSAPKPARPAKPAPVRTAKKESPAGKPPASKVRYTIQVAAYPDRGMAEDEVRGMKRRGYAAFVVATNLTEKGTWYRVRVGSFSNKQAAEKLAAELKTKEGITTFITTE